jgi:beta-1,4-mannooligosaccharide/beta-1,4-mannosyl-N-acetylglucosamine phosphorylase
MELFTRYDDNPVLEASDWPGEVNAVFNPAAVQHEGGTLLLVRVEDRTGLSHLGVARSADGLGGWTAEPGPALVAEAGSQAERFGIEDPRITRIGDEYLIVCTGYSTDGPLIFLYATRDFRAYERRGVLLPPLNKDAALFPETFGGRYVLIHRPMGEPSGKGAGMWLSRSPDLMHWGDHRPLLAPGAAGSWDAEKIGLGPPPLLTRAGWLLLVHGVRTTASGAIYRAGLVLLDREHPERVLARSPDWVFGPSAPYERVGDVANVVFPCGWVLAEDGDTLRVYYGAADTCVCVAVASVARLLEHLA